MQIFTRWTVTTHKVCGCNCKIMDNGFCAESLKEENERSHLTYYNPHLELPGDFANAMCQLTPHDKWTRRYWEIIHQDFHKHGRILDLNVGLSSYHPSLSISMDNVASDKKSRGYGTNCVTYMTLWKESKELDENHMQERFKEQLRNYQEEGEEQDAECTIV